MKNLSKANLMHKIPPSKVTYVSSKISNSCVRQWLCLVQNMISKIKEKSAKLFSFPGKLLKNKIVKGKKVYNQSSLIV